MIERILVSRHINITYVDVGKILVNGKKLEALKIERVDSGARKDKGLSRERGLELSKGELPQRLRSAHFSRLVAVFDGFAGLMTLLSACPSLTDIGIVHYPDDPFPLLSSDGSRQWGHPMVTPSYIPIAEVFEITPTPFSSELLTDPAMWKLLTSFCFYIPSDAERRHLMTKILPRD